MRKKILSVLMVMVLVVLSSSALSNQVSLADSNAALGKISAVGKASIKATPDMAYVTIGVEKQNPAVEKAQSEVTGAMNGIMDSLKKLGIKESDIKTMNYNIYPNYKWLEKDQKQVITGYTVSHQLEVTIKNVKDSGKLLDQVVKSGGNFVSGIRFAVSNHEALYHQALENAVKNAKLKAEAMGKGLGISNLKPLQITEQSVYSAPYMRNEMFSAVADAAAKTEIMPGEMEITAEVFVEFGY